MELLLLTQLLAGAALLFTLAWLIRIGSAARAVSVDYAPPKGSPNRGVVYALTLGMMPWAKESTRRHPIAYLRGVAFHGGLAVGLLALLASLWWGSLPVWLLRAASILAGSGAALGVAGILMRLAEPNLRALSTPDDYAAVLLVSAFLISVSAALILPAGKPVMYAIAALMFLYIPLGKIRHCFYFFFSRRFFGWFIGRRAVIHAEASR